MVTFTCKFNLRNLITREDGTTFLTQEDKYVNKQLAKTLETISESKNATEIFYEGSIARNLTKEIMDKEGKVVTSIFVGILPSLFSSDLF